MAISVICPSCGHRQSLPDDFPKRKVRCPECGVLCPVEMPAPAATPAKKSSSKTPDKSQAEVDVEEMARQLWSEPDELPAKKVEPPPPPPSPPQRDKPEPARHDDEDDSSPYTLSGGPIHTCPECHAEIDRSAVVCVACGYDFRKKTKTAKTYEPLERHWHTGMSLKTRVKLFIVALAIAFVPAVVFAVVMEQWIALTISFLFYSTMVAFLLGTFDRIHLVRDARGRTKLTKTWRVCFLEREPIAVDLTYYAELVTRRASEASFSDWVVFCTLLLIGLVPGILWYRMVIAATQFEVALARDHGYAGFILYRGGDEGLMRDIATTLRDAARLRLDG